MLRTMLNWSTILDWLPEPVAEFLELVGDAVDNASGAPRDVVANVLHRAPDLVRWVLPLLSRAMADPAATLRLMSQAEPLMLRFLTRLEDVSLTPSDVDSLLSRISAFVETTATRSGPDRIGDAFVEGMERLLVGWIEEVGSHTSDSAPGDPS